MKSIRFVLTACVVLFFSVNSFAQMNDHPKMTSSTPSATKTESFKVLGNCDLCKARIEKASKIEGVSKADWNKNSKMLTLVYNPSKVKSDDVLKKVAAIGHDADKFKAETKAYNNLPGCCQYDRK